MENVIHRLTLDLTGPDMCPMIEVQRGDSARTLIISLTQGGRPYWIDEGLTAALFATKPDGNPLFNACTIEKNRIRYDFTPQTANVAGAFDCEIWLVAGDKREMTTPRFTIAVDERMRTDDVIPESAPEYTAITEMVAAGTAMIEELRKALAGLEGVEEILTQARAAAAQATQEAKVANQAANTAAGHATAAGGHAKTAADAAADSLKFAGQAYTSEQNAVTAAGDAQVQAETAEGYAVRAEQAAERAEQAAASGGTGGNGSGSGQNVDLTGYAKEAWVQEGFQPKGNYATPNDIPKVPAWAMQTSKPAYTASEVGARSADWMPTAQEVGALPSTTVIPTVPTKVSAFTNDAGYLTEHQDISGKLDADKLPEAVEDALAQAKASGEFDGKNGDPGVSPTVAVSAITGGHRISITDKSGTKTVDVMDGEDGDPGDPGRGIKSIARTSGNGAAGTTDTYTITYTDNATSTFTVRNGSNGAAGKAATFEITGATALAYGAAPTISEQSDSTAQARKYKLGIPAGKPGADGKNPILTMYISPDGSDSNDGLTADAPKKTVKACVNAGASRISAKRGVYREVVQLWNIGELEIFPADNDLEHVVGVEREAIVFEVVDSVAVSSLAAYNSIKRVAYSNANNTQFDKVFAQKSQPPVVSDYGSRYNATVWLLSNDEKTVCIKLKPVLTVAECEAEGNTFTYVSGYIYINADLTGVEKIVVPANWESGFYINGAQRLVLKEVEVRFSGTYNIDIRNCAYFDFYKCSCKCTSYGSGFHPVNSNGKLTSCYATKNYDGYAPNGYGHTVYIDCVSEFNFDDGMSHHAGTTGAVIGGRFEGNGKGGNTPAYGAKVNIYGGLYKDNASFGIGYLWATDLEPASGMVQGAVMVGNPVGLVVNKNCNVTAMGCIYQGNTVDVENKGNLIEYNPAYVKSVNGIKPDENGNVQIDVSGGGGETAGYTNVLPLAINADGAPYVGDNGEKGYKTGCRVSSSGVEKASDRNCCSGFIACKSGDVIRIKNGVPETTGYSVQYPFNEAFERIASAKVDMSTATAVNGVYNFTIPAGEIAYIRLTLGTIDDTTIVTVNEEIPA